MNAYIHWDWIFTFPASKRFIERFQGTFIKGVFTATTPWFGPQFTFKDDQMIGDVAVFQEMIRWSRVGDNKNGRGWEPAKVAEKCKNRSKGSLNFIYKIWDVPVYICQSTRWKFNR